MKRFNSKRKHASSIVLASLVAAAALAGCISALPNIPGSGDAVEVDMKDLKYLPAVLEVAVGTTVVWRNSDPMGHTVTPTDKAHWGTEGSGDATADWIMQGQTWSFTFTKVGTFEYYCIPHAFQGSDGKYQGMVAKVIVTADGGSGGQSYTPPDVDVVADAVAPALKAPDADGIVRYELVTHEVVARINDDAAYGFWTFDGTVPGPMLRVREGDRVEVTITNPAESKHRHNIDLHAVTGPGGGAGASVAAPGESASFTFKALNPGVYVYHCATPHIPTHVANGMYGMIVVEPSGGLAPVDKEFYVVQGELYTNEPLGSSGLLTFSPGQLLAERPEYIMFNGGVAALTGDRALTAEVGDVVRIFFGVGGATTSSFHVIGEVFDRVYLDGDDGIDEPSRNRQTVMVPAAGSVTVEFLVDYPGTYILVDHTLSRTIDRGAVAQLIVTGEADDSIFQGEGDGGH